MSSFESTLVRRTTACLGPPARSRHVFPDMVHPSERRWAHGAPFGPFIKLLTFKSSGASLPIRRCTSALSSRGGISSAICFKCGNLAAVSGVAISRLSRGMLSHSTSVGRSSSMPFNERM